VSTEITTPTVSPDVRAIDRWRRWCGITLAVQLGTFIFYSALICGCHFHWSAVPVGLIPVAWSGFTLVSYHALGERIVSYVTTAFAIGWLYFAWVSNIRFVFL
jgi:hypothetical protein